MERSAFLARIRGGLGNSERFDPSIPDDWAVAIDEPVSRFSEELKAVAGNPYVATVDGAGEVVAELVRARAGERAPRVLVAPEDGVPPGVDAAVEGAGGEVLAWPEAGREQAASADIGVTSARWAIAETGTIVVSSAPPGGRAPSLLPPCHVAFVPVERLVTTTAALFRELGALPEYPSNMVLITGPSKSADIGMELIRGVHGPGELHVVLLR